MPPLPRNPAPPPAEVLLPQALALHQGGRLVEAEAIYGQILARHPRHADAQNLRGLVLYQQGDHAAAAAAFRRAITLRPGIGDYHRNLGMALRAAGQPREAAAATRKAVQLQPAAPQGHFNLGNILLELGDPEGAARAFRMTLSLHPAFLPAQQNLATLLITRGRHAEAEALLHAMLAQQPQNPDALFHLGLIRAAEERWDEAEEQFRQAHAAGLDSVQLWLKRGIACQEQARWAEAEAAYRAAVARQPDLAEGWFGLGACLLLSARKEGQKEEGDKSGKARDLAAARAAFEQAIAVRPDYRDALYNLAGLHQETGDLPAARRSLERLLEPSRTDWEVLDRLANIATLQGDHAGALLLAREASLLVPGNEVATTNLARLLLVNGHYAEGWDAYEQRRRDPLDPPLDMGLPAWDGAALPGDGRVLIWRDQGVGDEIMFCGILPGLIAAGHRFTLICDRRLEPLFARSLPGVEFLHRGPPPPHLRAQLGMSSLPRLFRRDEAAFAAQAPYLRADPALRAAARARYAGLNPEGAPVLGLSWHTLHPETGIFRSLPLAGAAPLVRAMPCRWVSLQYGDHAALRAALAAAELPVRVDDAVDPLRSLEEAVAQVDAMDHVVTIDNSVAHIAGALGKRCELLLPQVVDFRWQLRRSDTPWYPGLRLWRQSRQGEWCEILEKVSEVLRQELHLSP